MPTGDSQGPMKNTIDRSHVGGGMGREKTLEVLGKNQVSAASEGTKDPTQVEDGNLNTRFLEYHSITSSPPSKKKVMHLTALTPNFVFKNGLLSSSSILLD